MEDIEFSAEFCRFLKLVIPAVPAAELLLLLHRRREHAFSPEEAVATLGPGLAVRDAREYLDGFAANGIAEVVDGLYRFHDSLASPMVERLAQAFSQRPVTLVRVIYALRDDKIQSFADAFKLKKPPA